MKQTLRDRLIAYALFTGWLLVVVCAAWNHAVWRDEVRALSKALEGSNVVEMLKDLLPEGHPALWYLLLRGAYALAGKLYVLQIVALLVAAAAALLLVLRAPFPWWVKGILLAGNTLLFEYSVMARNYGISMLLLFLLATFYYRHRGRGLLLGLLLFLLANCNPHSILLVGGFLLLWLTDIVTGDRALRAPALRVFAWNAALAIVGIVVCILTIRNASQNYAVAIAAPAHSLLPLVNAVVSPGSKFEQLIMQFRPAAPGVDPVSPLFRILLTVILFGSTLGLIESPGAFLAALVTLTGFSVLFTFLYLGGYRHEALWLSFLITCYWIAADRPGARRSRLPAAIGWGFFLLLMASQVPIGIASVLAGTGDRPPFSRSRDFGDFMDSRPDLHDAILMADPDFLLESMRYYVSNPTYLLREQRFGKVVIWTRNARLKLSLDDVLTDARRLHAETGKPVVILLSHPLDPTSPPMSKHEGYAWEFVTTPDQVRTFLSATKPIESFPTAVMDEWFDAYLLIEPRP